MLDLGEGAGLGLGGLILDEFTILGKRADEKIAVIAAASARHEGFARACLDGLSQHSKITGKSTHYIHVRFPYASSIFLFHHFSHALVRRLVLP